MARDPLDRIGSLGAGLGGLAFAFGMLMAVAYRAELGTQAPGAAVAAASAATAVTATRIALAIAVLCAVAGPAARRGHRRLAGGALLVAAIGQGAWMGLSMVSRWPEWDAALGSVAGVLATVLCFAQLGVVAAVGALALRTAEGAAPAGA